MNMATYVCDNCGKGTQRANAVSHAKNRTHIFRKPNLHAARVVVNGEAMKLKLCTKCIRMAKKLGIRKGSVAKVEAPVVAAA